MGGERAFITFGNASCPEEERGGAKGREGEGQRGGKAGQRGKGRGRVKDMSYHP